MMFLQSEGRARQLGRRLLPALAVVLVGASVTGCKAIENLTNPSVATARTLQLRITPEALPEGGGDVELEATVMVGSSPESGVPVTFRSSGGTFVNGNVANTDGAGKARVILRVTSSVEVSANMEAGGVTVAETRSHSLPVGDDVPPSGTVRFEVDAKPKPAEADEPVIIDIRANNNSDGSRAQGQLKIEFGDGKQTTISNFDGRAEVQHTYKEPSIFNIVVSLSDGAGDFNRAVLPLKVVDGTETNIAINASTAEGFAREEMEFTVELTEDSGRRGSGEVTIDWGDGRGERLGMVQGNEKVAHTYRERGGYKVEASVETENGKVARTSFRVRVGNPISLEGQLSGSSTATVDASTRFNFNVERSDGRRPEGELRVSFGDGSGARTLRVDSANTTFDHTFRRAGGFQVNAEFKDEDGRTAKDAMRVDVHTEPVFVPNDGGGGSGGDGGGGSGGGGGGGGPDAINPSSITWLHTNVSGWPVTSSISSVSVSASQICIRHSKAGRWPNPGGIEGNPWIIANIGGRWYAATYEWLRGGQICKGLGVPQEWPNTARSIGPHTKRSPLSSWVPKKGETVYMFVSTWARDGRRTSNERSNIVKVVWPY